MNYKEKYMKLKAITDIGPAIITSLFISGLIAYGIMF